MPSRKTVPVDAKALVLHEGGYRCANPACRMVLTLDVHHLDQVSDGGANEPANLLALCPNCHALHHRGTIPVASLRAWKHLLLALNHAFDNRLVDLLLTLSQHERIWVSGDGVLRCAAGIASGLISVETRVNADNYFVCLTPKGRTFVAEWKAGNETAAIGVV